eukprot:PLAT6918.1.p1 GENE.PLAT6918.1~~PLAT6918.1.p1  ORF type:complete len:337 (+),score=194.66 PLAT6918.1:51-1013(+)
MADAGNDDRIRTQVEFYFSDCNFPGDKHLKATAEAGDGWVELEHICSFARMRQFGATVEGTAALLKESDVVELSDDGKKLKRRHPVPEDWEQVQLTCSVYMKGFPEESKLDDLLDWLRPHGDGLLAIRQRRRRNKAFKGSLIAIYKTPEQAAAVAGKSLKYEEAELEVMSKAAWQEDYEKRKAAYAEAAAEEEKQEDFTTKEIDQKGVVVSFSGVGDDVSREDFKEQFGEYGEVAYVDFSRGDTSGYVRMTSTEAVAAAVAGLAEKEVKFGGAVPKLAVLEGDEEKEYWIKLWTQQRARRGQKRRGGGGRRGHYKKRRRD